MTIHRGENEFRSGNSAEAGSPQPLRGLVAINEAKKAGSGRMDRIHQMYLGNLVQCITVGHVVCPGTTISVPDARRNGGFMN